MDHSADKQTHLPGQPICQTTIRMLQEADLHLYTLSSRRMYWHAHDVYSKNVDVILQNTVLWVNTMSGILHKKDHSGPRAGGQAGKGTVKMQVK